MVPRSGFVVSIPLGDRILLPRQLGIDGAIRFIRVIATVRHILSSFRLISCDCPSQGWVPTVPQSHPRRRGIS